MSKFLHILLYVTLFAVLAVSGSLLWYLQGQRQMMLFVIIGTAVFYVIWGSIHHSLEDEFDFEVLLDYLLVAGLVIVIYLLAVKY